MGSKEQPNDATVAKFIEHLRKNKMSEETIRAYSSDVKGFLQHSGPLQRPSGRCSSDLDSIVAMQTKDIEEYLSNLARAGSSYSSVRRTSYALKNFFLFLVHQGAMKNNPAYALRVTPAHSDVLSTDQIVSIFHYLHRRQASTEQGETVRHQRDDLILFLMIFYGVRQNQVCALKLSTLEANDKSVSLIISTLSTLRLHAQVLRKLRSYLQSRKSNSDVIFLDALGKKPLDYWSIRHSLNDLSQALQLDCSPKALYHTFLSLQQHQEIREPLISKVLSIGTTLKHGAIPNA